MNLLDYFDWVVMVIWHLSWLLIFRIFLIRQFPQTFPDNTAFQEQIVTAVAVPAAIVVSILLTVLYTLILGEHEFRWDFIAQIAKIVTVCTVIAWPIYAVWLRIHGRSARLNYKPVTNAENS